MSIPGFDPASAPTLRRGSSGEWVAFLQGALTVLGYEPGVPDGDFGSNTERAVGRFQADHGLTADGVVGPATWREISETSTGGGESPGGGTEPGGGADTGRRQLDPATAPLLREGDEGDWVLYLQNLLEAEGADPGPLDGDFGPLTKGAVVRFQLRAGIDVDGVVGSQTWGALKPYADAHPMEPPYGSSVHHGGGGGGHGGGGHGGSGHGVTVAVQPAEQIVDESLTFHFPVTNGGGQRVYARHVAWEASAQGRSLASEELIEEWLDPGQMGEATVTLPGGPAPDGETYEFLMQATAIYELDGSDADLRTVTITRTITVDDQGRTTGSSPSGGGGAGGTDPSGSEVSLTVIPDSELDAVGDGLNLNFDVLNASDAQVVIMSIEWSIVSGVSTQTGHVDPSDVLGPQGSLNASDVALMGPAADEPYSCTATATVLYAVGDQVKRSAPATRSFTVDAEGKVGGSARGGGGGDAEPEPQGHPVYGFHPQLPNALWENKMLYANAQVGNDGDGVAEGVVVRAAISGPLSAANETHADSLPPGEGIVAEVSVNLPEDRTDTYFFVFECGFSTADGAQHSETITMTVAPDGQVLLG
ncbi:MAG TPA: peptidoglycan-binding protein [Acidimicrobiales bacterium]